MHRIRIASVAFIVLSLLATATSADMPEELRGSWILDAKATEHNIMTSPKWSPETAKYLPRIIERMSHYVFHFDDGVIIASGKVKKETLAVVLKNNDKVKHVFEGQIRDKTITMTITFVNDTTINIRSSATDDMNYYLWKRGRLDKDETKDDDKSIAIELMKESLNNSSNKPDAGDGK